MLFRRFCVDCFRFYSFIFVCLTYSVLFSSIQFDFVVAVAVFWWWWWWWWCLWFLVAFVVSYWHSAVVPYFVLFCFMAQWWLSCFICCSFVLISCYGPCFFVLKTILKRKSFEQFFGHAWRWSWFQSEIVSQCNVVAFTQGVFVCSQRSSTSRLHRQTSLHRPQKA